MSNNGADKDVAISALSRAIDHITASTLEKLVSVETRIDGLKAAIESKTAALKEGLIDLVKTIDATSQEADTLHDKVDQIEQAIEILPTIKVRAAAPGHGGGQKVLPDREG